MSSAILAMIRLNAKEAGAAYCRIPGFSGVALATVEFAAVGPFPAPLFALASNPTPLLP